jgi:hypothetical protein
MKTVIEWTPVTKGYPPKGVLCLTLMNSNIHLFQVIEWTGVRWENQRDDSKEIMCQAITHWCILADIKAEE